MSLPPWIPEEVSEAMKAAAESHWAGKIEVHFNDGHAVEIHATRKVKVRRNGAVSPETRCPECTKPMESRDYGNLWTCSCGVKRTRTQLVRQGVPL